MSALLQAFSIEPDAPLAAPLRFAVPVVDNDEFAGLKPKWRTKVQLTMRVLERIHQLHGQGDSHFVESVGALASGYRHVAGFSAPSLLRKYGAFAKSGGDWRTLVPGYRSPSHQSPDFISFIKGLIEQNHRSVAMALETLREELWPAGVSIPGYGTWQEWFAATYPAQPVPVKFPRVWPKGWSSSNLRRYGPSRAELVIFQRGIGAAHSYMPTLRRDTSALRPLEWIVIDDFQLDTMCCFPGDRERGIRPQVAYVAGLLAMCVGTRKHLARLLGPLVETEEKQPDGTVKIARRNIRAADVQVLLYEIFRAHGLPEYPVTIICENATAQIAPALELMLSTIYEGRIRVHRTSLIEHKTLTNGFIERGGTPWEKGWIESGFNVRWNRLNTVPGYKGSNERLNGPADHADKLKYVAKFLGQGAGKANLPAEVIAELHLPFENIATLELAFDYVSALLERRTKHKMQGFGTITEFRWPTPELPAPEGIDAHGPNDFRALALLTSEQQRQMIPVERKECPLERFERLSAAHPRVALKPGVLALFLLTPKQATWRNHAVTFTHDKVGYSYIDDDNLLADVAEGTEVLAYVDLREPSTAMIARKDGTQIGILRMLGSTPAGVDVLDTAAIDEARARRAVVVNRVLAGVRSRPQHIAANEIMLANRDHNEAVVAAWQGHEAAQGIAPTIVDNTPATATAVATEQRAAKRVQARNERAATALQDADELDATTLF